MKFKSKGLMLVKVTNMRPEFQMFQTAKTFWISWIPLTFRMFKAFLTFQISCAFLSFRMFKTLLTF